MCKRLADLPSADEARSMLQGIGSRFDFHVCKTLSDLRSVLSRHPRFMAFLTKITCSTKEIFDIIIDYPDSLCALQDLKVCIFVFSR